MTTYTAAQVAANLQAILVSGANVTIVDSAYDVNTYFTTLETLANAGVLSSINITNSGPSQISLTVSQLLQSTPAGIQGVVNNISNPSSNVFFGGVVDSAADVMANFVALENLYTTTPYGELPKIWLNDPTNSGNSPQISLTVAQLLASTPQGIQTVLNNINSGDPHSFYFGGVVDSAADVMKNFVALENLYTTTPYGELPQIWLNDPTNSGNSPQISLTVAQLLASTPQGIQTVLNNINSGDPHSFYFGGVVDSAADVMANFVALENLYTTTPYGELPQIWLNDPTNSGNSPQISLTVAQLLASTPQGIQTVLNNINSGDPHSFYFGGVVDSAADVMKNFVALENLYSTTPYGELPKIWLSDPSTPLNLTVAQLLASTPQGIQAVLSNIQGGSSLQGVVDTSADIRANFVALEQLYSNAPYGSLPKIFPTDNGPLSLTVAQLLQSTPAGFSAVLNNIQGGIAFQGVVDSTADIRANFVALEQLYSNAPYGSLPKIFPTDNGTLSLTVAQMLQSTPAGFSAVLNNIQGGIAFQGVVDSTADIRANFVALEQLYGNAPYGSLPKIFPTDNGTLSLTVAQMLQSTPQGITSVLNNIQGGIAFQGVVDSTADIRANFVALEQLYGNAPYGSLPKIFPTDNGTLSLTVAQMLQSTPQGITSVLNNIQGGIAFQGVVDSTADIRANFVALEQLYGNAPYGSLPKIFPTDNGTLSLTVAQMLQSTPQGITSVLNNIQGGIAFQGVVDSSANVDTNFVALEKLYSSAPYGSLPRITLTDNGSLSLTAAQMANSKSTGIQSLLNNIQGGVSFKGVVDSLSNVMANLTGLEQVYGSTGSLPLSLTAGDANGDGIVNGLDIAQVSSNWMRTGGGAGDVNGDGIVNGLDIAQVSSNWMHTGPTQAQVTANLASIENLYANPNSQLPSISLTGMPLFMLSATQLDAAAPVLSNIITPYTLIASGTSGNDTFVVGKNNDALIGEGGNDNYVFGSSFGQDTINNVSANNTTAHGQIDFVSGITDQSLWLQKSGNNLVIDLMGTNDSITVSNWFTSANYQVASITTADGMKLDSQVNQLVSAMATYGASHPGFNPTTAQMPADATLQAAITAAYHH